MNNNEEILTGVLKSYTESIHLVEAKLDAIYQLIQNGDDPIIATNIQTRYQVDGKDCLQNVKNDLKGRGFQPPDFYNPLELDSVVMTEMDQILRSAIYASIRQLDPNLKLVARKLAFHEYRRVSTFFYRNRNWTKSSFSWSIGAGANEDEVDKTLVQIGLINHGWYKSEQYDNPTWYIPQYAFPVLDSIKQSPEWFDVPRIDIEEIRKLTADPAIMTFVKWLLKNRIGPWNNNLKHHDGLLVTIQDDSEFNLWLKEAGSSGPDVLGKLVRKGALTLKPDAGKKSSSPQGRTPDTCEFRLTMPFLEALLKEKRLKVDLIED